MREELYQGNHPDIALLLNVLGHSYYKLKDVNKCLEYHRKAF